MAGYRVVSDNRPDVAEIFPGTLKGLEDAILRARELSAACSPREVRKGPAGSAVVIRRYENGIWTGGEKDAI
jgi:hypothetical protein